MSFWVEYLLSKIKCDITIVEQYTFDNFFEAIYWVTVSLTTVGYGENYTVSVVGKIITLIAALFGIAIVALPAGSITPGYMEEIQKSRSE